MVRALRRSVVVGFVAAGLLVGATSSAAHDSLAPPGASHNWLPADLWVYAHSVPFDEQALYDALGLNERSLEAYLYDDHHRLADLAIGRGMTVDQLADRLMHAWDGADANRRTVLRDRTVRILTQGHLAQHMLFHVFHGAGIRLHAQEVLGVTAQQYAALRRGRTTFVEIARRSGVGPEDLNARMTAVLLATHDEGIRRGETPPAEADRMLARQTARLPCWLSRPTANNDRGNPYGKNRLAHGLHTAGWPFTISEHYRDAYGVERVRRHLPPSCWPRPHRWRWHADGRPVVRRLSCPLPPARQPAGPADATDRPVRE